MKLFIFFLLIAAVVAEHHGFQENKKSFEEYKKIKSDCYEKFHVTDEQKEKLKNSEYPDDESVHKFVHCVSSGLGVWCDDQGYLKDVLKTQFEGDIASILDKCITKNDEHLSTEKWAWYNWKCMVAEGLIKKHTTTENHHHHH